MAWHRSTKSVAIFFIYILFIAYRVNGDGIIGGLTLYINRRVAENMGLSVTNDIFLIQNGKPNQVFDDFGEVLKFKSLSSNVQRVEMNMFATKYPVRYSLSVTSSNVEIMPQPRILSIESQGTVKQERNFQISLPCSGYADGSVNIKFVLNYTNYKGKELDRASKRTLEFTVAKQCGKRQPKTTQTTPKKAKTNLDRTIVVTVGAVLACVVCVLVGVLFFWRFVKRMRKKFGFDQATERFVPLSQVPCQSIASTSDCQVATTIVYSAKGKGLRNSFFTKIAKRQESKRDRDSSSTNSDGSYLIPAASRPPSVNSTSTTKEQFASRDLFSQHSMGEDDVFACEQSDEVALIQNSPSSLTLAKEWESKNDMYSTLNEYWASQLRDSLCSRQQVEIRSAEVIGEGAFGRVLRGTLLTQQQTSEATHGQIQRVDVAVKVCQHDIEFEQMVSFVNEAILMTVLDHVNLLNLLGVVLQPSCPPLILTPFLSHGDLHTFLRHSRGIGSRRQLIGSRQLVNFAAQIALGMEYLSSKKVVHRDLAARNCFVDEHLNVKIGDFGLAKNIDQFDLHKMEHTTQLPVKWLALESLLYYIFTEKSDIWSFGIVLWELVTLGSQPYAGLDNYEVTPYLETGKRLSRPLRCPDDLYAMMYSCWLASPDERPTFSILVHKLEDYEVRLRHSCIAFEFDEDTIEMNDDCEYV